MYELEMRNYLIQKYFDLTEQLSNLNIEAAYQSRWNPTICSKKEYLSTRLDLLEEILEDLSIEIPACAYEEVM